MAIRFCQIRSGFCQSDAIRSRFLFIQSDPFRVLSIRSVPGVVNAHIFSEPIKTALLLSFHFSLWRPETPRRRSILSRTPSISNLIYTQLTAAVTSVAKLLHNSPAFKLLTLDLVADVIALEISEPTFRPPNSTVMYKFVFCTKVFSELTI